EQEILISWQDPPAWDSSTGRESEPPGLGRFLVKVGGHPGIPLKVELLPFERAVNDTNVLWHSNVPIDPELAADPQVVQAGNLPCASRIAAASRAGSTQHPCWCSSSPACSSPEGRSCGRLSRSARPSTA